MLTVHTVATSPVLQSCGMHRHDCWEIILNLSGCGTETIGETELPFGPGDLSVCPPGVMHAKRCAPGACWQDMYLGFSDDGFCVSRLRFADDAGQSCLQLFRMLQSAGAPGGACRRALGEALCALVREWDEREPLAPPVERMIRRMTLDYSDPEFSARRAMQGLGYCEDYLRRVFQAATRQTPTEYLTALRVAHARELLSQDADATRPVREIALLCGFYDADYFSRIFRARTGTTPSAYRQGSHPL